MVFTVIRRCYAIYGSADTTTAFGSGRVGSRRIATVTFVSCNLRRVKHTRRYRSQYGIRASGRRSETGPASSHAVRTDERPNGYREPDDGPSTQQRTGDISA